MLYGNKYKDIREAVALSLCGSDISELQAAIKVWDVCMQYVIDHLFLLIS